MDTNASFKVIGDGTAKVATPGTAVQLTATSTPCRFVEVTAFSENVGVLSLGSSTTLATAGARRGRELAPGQMITVRIEDVSSLYIDGLNANDGVAYAYYKVTQ